MIWRLSGWSSTTKMRLLIPFPPAARLDLHSRERADENASGTPSVPVSAMPLLHTLSVRRGVAQELLSTCRLRLSLDNNREPEGKCRALARLRLDPDLAAAHLDDAFRYGKPQAGAAFLAGDGIVGLLKLLKQVGLIGSRDARSGVTDRDIEGAIVRFDLDVDFARISELDGIADEIDQYLRKTPPVAATWREFGSHLDFECELFVGRQRLKRAAHGLGNILDAVIRQFEHQLAGLDLGQVENIIDETE